MIRLRLTLYLLRGNGDDASATSHEALVRVNVVKA